MGRRHAVNSPSVLERRLGCLRSRWLEMNAPRESSMPADRGTAGHEVLERCIRREIADIDTMVGAKWKVGSSSGVFSKEDIEALKCALAYIDDRGDELDANEAFHVYPETEVDPAEFTGRDDTSGRCDILLVGRQTESFERVLEVVDYKHGHTPVMPIKMQCFAYAGGGLAKFGPENFDLVRLTIIGPNFHPEAERLWRKRVAEDDLPEGAYAIGLDEWKSAYWVEYPPHVIINALREAGRQLDFADDPNCVATASEENCQFCKGKAQGCAAYVEYHLNPQEGDDAPDVATVRTLFGIDIQSPETLVQAAGDAVAKMVDSKGDFMTPEQHAALFKSLPLLRSLIGEIESSALERHQREPLPGLKLVQGRQGNRAWRDPDEALAVLGKGVNIDSHRIGKRELMVYALKSPTQVEKELQAVASTKRGQKRVEDLMEQLVHRPDGKLKLVVDSHPTEDQMERMKTVLSDGVPTEFRL
jgi:hypothetical protein